HGGRGSFFFSSRRRHTRWPRDWSSDVCSSDLARLARPSGRWLDSEPMATQRKNRRKKPDRRSGADRRTEQAPVEVELRKGERRRTALTRRLELETAADQIHAALGLLTYAQDQGLLLDVDRWLLGTAIARLRVAMEQLGEGTGDAV